MKRYWAYSTAYCIALFVGCAQNESHDTVVRPQASTSMTDELGEFLRSTPTPAEVEEKIASLDLGIPFSMRQDNPYGWDLYRIPRGGRLTVCRWGDAFTSVKLEDGSIHVISEIQFGQASETD